ncbi:thiamine phosphate synthase [Chloroflexota bacterium]
MMMASPEAETLRIIDANLNRIGEGLRVLEDLARFVLNAVELTQRLKNMRHNLLISDWSFQQQLLQARNAAGDVGVGIEVSREKKMEELPTVVIANARRVQEALRVMEELAKNTGLDANKFLHARFSLYELEQALLFKLLRQDKIKHLRGLYVIIDTQALPGKSPTEAARQAIRGGTAVIQLRDKMLSKKELMPIAQELRELCAEHDVLFIVNDYLDLALAIDADGLHLGQDDLPIKVARKLLAGGKILGCSTRTVDQAIAAESDGADYIAVSAIYPTGSKERETVVGPERLRQIRQAVSVPLVAIGGITRDNAAEALAAGSSSVAVISAVLQAEDIESATRDIVDKLEIQV